MFRADGMLSKKRFYDVTELYTEQLKLVDLGMPTTVKEYVLKLVTAEYTPGNCEEIMSNYIKLVLHLTKEVVHMSSSVE